MNRVNLNTQLPDGVPQQQLRAQLNNQIAAAMASADPRFNVKQMDRAGVSRGAGQWNQAGINAAKSLADGIADAYSTQLQGEQYNANAALQSRMAQEQQAQALGALNQQNAYANQMAALQRQNQMLGLLGGLLN